MLSQLCAGGFAGAMSRTVTAPVDRIRLFMQAGSIKGTVREVARKSVERDGFLSLWRGNGVNCVKIVPETALRFVIFDELKSRLGRDLTEIRPSERFLAGAVAGAISQAVVYPLEIVRTRLALADVHAYRGPVHCLTTVVRQEGVRHLYSGLRISVIGIIPFAGIDLAINSGLREYVTQQLAEQESRKTPSVGVMLGCGMISSSTAMVATFPLGLIRTRLQVSHQRSSVCFWTLDSGYG